MKLVIYKLERPTEQVGLPAAFKWAVGVLTDGVVAFQDAFRTQRAAKGYIRGRGCCTVCGEAVEPHCACERDAGAYLTVGDAGIRGVAVKPTPLHGAAAEKTRQRLGICPGCSKVEGHGGPCT